MSIILKEGSTKVREIIPSGTHIGRCYSMIHIGTVQWEYQGEVKHTDKVRLTFELPHETRTFEGVEKPLVISKEYTVSLHEKSNLRKDLMGWRGADFTVDDLAGFELTDLLEQTANVSVIHKTGKNGNEFAQLQGLSKLTKGVECPEQFNPTFQFNYNDHFDTKWLDEQPEWVQKQIKSTDEYISKMNEMKFADTPKDDLPF